MLWETLGMINSCGTNALKILLNYLISIAAHLNKGLWVADNSKHMLQLKFNNYFKTIKSIKTINALKCLICHHKKTCYHTVALREQCGRRQ